MTDVPVYRSSGAVRSGAKRALDLIGAAAGLTLGLPLLAAIALAVRWTAGSPVLHAQTRTGRGGRSFRLYKFRTLPLEASAHAASDWTAEATHPFLGWLRRTGLDEAPQLWNVVRGEMSLVGPRPERPYFVDKFSRELPHYQLRLQGPPGITGLAQVRGLRGNTSIERRLELDLEYLRTRSLWLDLRILGRTAAVVLRTALTERPIEDDTETWRTRSTSSTS